ncbi:MAG: hypothetical protein K9G67_04775 [Bacteroidales bacterium]|nr:hypothetical protein [Bacteroidales bacterium]MCF8344667.1 hypothetical protein [Bacteroidales bacterium]MCF8351350.1 hypothetical protein [Bacteroidales bacterium]MCF8375647.1 hypothetical protein [Bacteroidales bacterium]MCF8400770.1 hypothetical protein [Bacteroidales bacterium]
MNSRIEDIVRNAAANEWLNNEEIALLYKVPLFTEEAAFITQAGRKKSEAASNGLAEVHAQVGLNVAPCPMNCMFCAFASANKLFPDSTEFTVEEVVSRSLQFEKDKANAIYLMATADYNFNKFLEMGKEVRKNLKDETVLIANVGDFNAEQAIQLKDAGFAGIYHALRLGEGKDTRLKVENRFKTFRNAKEAGLILGTCVEPVGPEHSIEELVEKTVINRDAQPCFSGSARRIPLPGSDMEKYGIVSEARMAFILAVVRLVIPESVAGNCTHEPNVIGAAAGANLLWAESGSNPRDTEEDTEGKRGMTVGECRQVLTEAEWDVLEGPSAFFKM